MYRFFFCIAGKKFAEDFANSVVDGSRASCGTVSARYQKPMGRDERLVSAASRDPRALVLLGFARFPIGRVENANCNGQALVQFADLRYTEPGASRGAFSLSVSVDCPAP